MVVPSGREVVTGVDSVETPVVVRLRGTWISERGPVGFVMIVISVPTDGAKCYGTENEGGERFVFWTGLDARCLRILC